MRGRESRWTSRRLGVPANHLPAPPRERDMQRRTIPMKQGKTAKSESEALRLLRAIVLELDFDEVEGHAPSDSLAALREQARRLIDAPKRQP